MAAYIHHGSGPQTIHCACLLTHTWCAMWHGCIPVLCGMGVYLYYVAWLCTCAMWHGVLCGMVCYGAWCTMGHGCIPVKCGMTCIMYSHYSTWFHFIDIDYLSSHKRFEDLKQISYKTTTKKILTPGP